MSVLDLINFDNNYKLTAKDNVFSCSVFTTTQSYQPLDYYTKGIDLFIEMHHKFKLIVFYDDSIPQYKLNIWNSSNKIVLFKFNGPYSDNNGLFGTIIRYLPLFTDIISFNYCYVIDIDRTHKQWAESFKLFQNIIKSKIGKIMYSIPLAGELLTRNIAARNLVHLNSWYRICAYPITFKNGNQLPIHIINNFVFDVVNTPEYDDTLKYILENEYKKADPSQYKFVYGCDELLLLYVMKYHEDNKINFIYSISVYTHRSPFYYWMEHIKPSEEKQKTFLKLMNSNEVDVYAFLDKFGINRRDELYTMIADNFHNNLSFFEDPIIENCIERFISCIGKNNSDLYLKEYN